MKLVISQLNTTINDFETNLSKIKSIANTHNSPEIDLIIFSECVLTGYPPKDLLSQSNFLNSIDNAIKALIEFSKSITPALCIGTPYQSQNTLTNSVLLLQNGKILHQQDKQLLPNYDIFDEKRYFQSGSQFKPIRFKDKTIGITICEDAWFHEHPSYDADPIKTLAAHSPDLIINCMASPYELDKASRRTNRFGSIAKTLNCPVVTCNQVGGNDELIFDGNSMAFDQSGQKIAQLASFKEDTQIIDLNSSSHPKPNTTNKTLESLYDALVLGCRDYCHKTGFKTAVLGLSGGIDSAVTACIASAALGPENVTTIAMPSQYSSEHSISDAEALANALNTNFHTIAIQPIVDSYLTQLKSDLKSTLSGLSLENIQPRIRGTLLMSQSNKDGHILIATGNKSEFAVGYSTLYGDSCGGLAVIGDLYKTTVYELANYINTHHGSPIPENTITKPPSAELKPDQKDQDTLPPYDVLDKLLIDIIENQITDTDQLSKHYDPEMIRWTLTAITRSEYKRFQSPPILKVSKKAFGSGRRIPLVKA